MEKENIREVKIFKDKEGKVKAYVRWGDEERCAAFPDFILAMYWAEDFLYGEDRNEVAADRNMEAEDRNEE